MDVPPNWVGYELGLSPPKLRAIGKAAFASPPYGEPPRLRVGPPPASGEPAREPASELRAQTSDGTIYQVRVDPEDMAKIASKAARFGLDGASQFSNPPTEADPPAPSNQGDMVLGWSSGVDNRVRWSNSNSDWPRDTIGVVSPSGSNWCTGTLFWGRLVLTAAHCLWNGTGTRVLLKFRAGQDGSTQPYSQSTEEVAYYDQAFVDHNCHNWATAGYDYICQRHDWAVLAIASTPYSSTFGTSPGYMNFTSTFSDSTVVTWVKYHYGYPGCSASGGGPAGCVANSLWGQTSKCGNGSFFNPMPGTGWNREFYHGCDMSGGHSGGPLYTWSPGSSGPYLVGVNIAEACTGSSCTEANVGPITTLVPNLALRLDKAITDSMTYWRSIY